MATTVVLEGELAQGAVYAQALHVPSNSSVFIHCLLVLLVVLLCIYPNLQRLRSIFQLFEILIFFPRKY